MKQETQGQFQMVKITAPLNRRNIGRTRYEVVQGEAIYKHARSPFFRYVQEEIKKERGGQNDESTNTQD